MICAAWFSRHQTSRYLEIDIFNMDGSALIGHLPNTEHDALVIKGYWKVVLAQSGRTLPPGNITATIPVMVPPGAPHDNHIPYAVAAPAVVIVLTTVLTGTRLGLRIFRPELRWGGDDWAILVGALGTVAWFGLMLAVPLHAGATKHLWDITYYEYARFYSVRRSTTPMVTLTKRQIIAGHYRADFLLPSPGRYQDLHHPL